MTVRIGLGLAEFPFSSPCVFWRWIELCGAGGVDSLCQSDRLTGPQPFLKCLIAEVIPAAQRLKAPSPA